MEKRLGELIELGNRIPDEAKKAYWEELGQVIGDDMFDPSDDSNFTGAFTAATALGISSSIQADYLDLSISTVQGWAKKAPPTLSLHSRQGYMLVLSNLLIRKGS